MTFASKTTVIKPAEKFIMIKDVLLEKGVLNVYESMRGLLSVTYNQNHLHVAFQ